MKCLVTGGAGFIGSAIATALALRGVDVVCFDNLSPQVHGADASLSFSACLARRSCKVVRGDVRSAQQLRDVLAGVTHVIHLAAETGTGQSMYAVSRYVDTNVSGTSLLVELLASDARGVQKVVVASSRAVYGEGRAVCTSHGSVYPLARDAADLGHGDFAPKCPLCGQSTVPAATDEESRPCPTSVYAITKLAQEQLVLTCCASLGIGATALRYQNVYGPGQSLMNPYTGILSIFSAAMWAGKSINVFEDGLESRDFVYIDDVVEATLRALLSDEANGEVINVGSGVRSTVIDVIRALESAYGASCSFRISGEFRLGDIRHNFADTSKLERILDFKPQVALSDGVARFGNWARGEFAKDASGSNRYEVSLREIRERGLLRSQESVGSCE